MLKPLVIMEKTSLLKSAIFVPKLIYKQIKVKIRMSATHQRWRSTVNDV